MNKLFQRSKVAASLIPLSLLLTFSGGVVAESKLELELSADLKGKQVFEHYGLDENIPKLAMSSLIQGEHLVEHATRKVIIGDEVRESSVFLVKNTDTKGNIDLRIKYNPEKLDGHENVIDEIESYTRTEYRLRNYAQSYDGSSVVATDHGDGKVSIEFNYSKYGLPQDIAYFRHLSVEVKLVDGEPITMVITNNNPFNYDKYRVDTYHQIIGFRRLDSGKLVIAKKHVEIHGKAKKKPVSLITTIEPVAIYDEDLGVNVLAHQRLETVSDPRMHEESVKLDRVFPLMGDMVRRQGIDLPLPFGISAAYRNQNMNIPFTDFVIEGVGLNDLFDPLGSIGVVNAESFTLRGDVNILPFWNVYGLVGKINVDADVDAEYTGEAGQYIRDKLNNKLPHLGDAFCNKLYALCNQGRLDVPLHLEYDLMGVGTTLSLGYREFFASVNGSYTTTRLKGTDNWGDGIITVQPMLGYQLVDYRAQLFVGAEYQGLDARMDGHVVAGDIEFDYDIGVKLNNWAYLVGFNKQIGKNYNITALYNKGETRDAITVNFGYRF
ncbi:hypothetical protein [Vibrio mexicanus]|uniref:hypothetical protein n=1 Tax=Vibrio mexicanus TaxID=1004326 RepID=UPI00063C94AD|nr:hypothetical protein [Vibrio mexicanus]